MQALHQASNQLYLKIIRNLFQILGNYTVKEEHYFSHNEIIKSKTMEDSNIMVEYNKLLTNKIRPYIRAIMVCDSIRNVKISLGSPSSTYDILNMTRCMDQYFQSNSQSTYFSNLIRQSQINQTYKRDSQILNNCKQKIEELRYEKLQNIQTFEGKINNLVEKVNVYQSFVFSMSFNSFENLSWKNKQIYNFYNNNKYRLTTPMREQMKQIEQLKKNQNYAEIKLCEFSELGVQFYAQSYNFISFIESILIFIKKLKNNQNEHINTVPVATTASQYQFEYFQMIAIIEECIISLRYNSAWNNLQNIKKVKFVNMQTKLIQLQKIINEVVSGKSNRQKSHSSNQNVRYQSKYQITNGLTYQMAKNIIFELQNKIVKNKKAHSKTAQIYWDSFKIQIQQKYEYLCKIEQREYYFLNFISFLQRQIMNDTEKDNQIYIINRINAIKSSLSNKINSFEQQKINLQAAVKKQQNKFHENQKFNLSITLFLIDKINSTKTYHQKKQLNRNNTLELQYQELTHWIQDMISNLRKYYPQLTKLNDENKNLKQLIRQLQDKIFVCKDDRTVIEDQKQHIQTLISLLERKQSFQKQLQTKIIQITKQNQLKVSRQSNITANLQYKIESSGIKILKQTKDSNTDHKIYTDIQLNTNPIIFTEQESNTDSKLYSDTQTNTECEKQQQKNQKSIQQLLPSSSLFINNLQFSASLQKNIINIKKTRPLGLNCLFSSQKDKSLSAHLVEGKSNILTIIKTQFNKIVGGFTNYPFNNQDLKEATNQKADGFIFQCKGQGKDFIVYPFNNSEQKIKKKPNGLTKQFLMYGQSDLRIVISPYNGMLSSNFGLPQSWFSKGFDYKKVKFLGSQKRDAKIEIIQVYEILFDTQSLQKQRNNDNIQAIRQLKHKISELEKQISQAKLGNVQTQALNQEIIYLKEQIVKLDTIVNIVKDNCKKAKEQVLRLMDQKDELQMQKLDMETKLQIQYCTHQQKLLQRQKECKLINDKCKKTEIQLEKTRKQAQKNNTDLLEMMKQYQTLKKKYYEEIGKQLNQSRRDMFNQSLEVSAIIENGQKTDTLFFQDFQCLSPNKQISEEVQLLKAEFKKQFQQQICTLQKDNTLLIEDKNSLEKEIARMKSDSLQNQKQIDHLKAESQTLSNEISLLISQLKQSQKIRQINKQYESALFQLVQSPPQSQRHKTKASCYPIYIHYHNVLFAGDIFDNDNQGRTRLISHIDSYMNNRIIKTIFLCKHDPKNLTNVHQYIDNKRGLVCIIKTEKAIVAGFYSGQLNDKKIMNDPALLISVTNNESYPLHQNLAQSQEMKALRNAGKVPSRAEERKIIYRGMVYDQFYIIFGNAEIRIRTGQELIFSNFGIASCHYNRRDRKIDYFLNEGENRQIKFLHCEYYQVIFEEKTKQLDRIDNKLQPKRNIA